MTFTLGGCIYQGSSSPLSWEMKPEQEFSTPSQAFPFRDAENVSCSPNELLVNFREESSENGQF